VGGSCECGSEPLSFLNLGGGGLDLEPGSFSRRTLLHGARK